MNRSTVAIYAVLLALTCMPLSAAEGGTAIDQAIRLFESGDLADARSGFEKVRASDPENHLALYHLGRISLAEEDHDDAVESLKTAVTLDENNSIYRTWLGRAYIQNLQTASFFAKGMLSGRALEQLQKAVKLDPNNVEARVSLAGYYVNAPSIAGGSKRKALEQAQEIVKHDPVRGNGILAGIHIKNEEYDQAIEKLDSCIAADPANTQYRYQLAMLQQKLDNYDRAFEILEGTLEFDPDNLAAIYQIGRTAAFSGMKVDRGIECLQNYLTHEVPSGYPGHDGAHWRLGILFEKKGDTKRARHEYEIAVRLNPDEDRYRNALKALDDK